MFSILYQIKTHRTTHGPTCSFECPKCQKTGYFILVSDRISFHLWFLPVGEDEGASTLQCPNCKFEIILNQDDAGEASAMCRYVRMLSDDELKETSLEFLLKKYPIEGLKTLLKANQNWTCPKCSSQVPDSMTSCWNCQYQF